MTPLRFFRDLTIVPAMIGLLAISSAWAGKQFVDDGLALSGYDPVAYFTLGGPAIGDADITHVWNDAIWQFASVENRDRFIADPNAFAPQYDGHCAFGASVNQLVPGNPHHWYIHDEKLYVNVTPRAQELWLMDVPGNIGKGDANWPNLNP